MSWIRALVATSVIYLAPLMVGATPFLALYWVYQPTVLANPGLNAHRAPSATVLLPPPRRLESLERTEAPLEASLASVAEAPAEARLDNEKPKSRQKAASGGPIRHSRNPPIGTSTKPLAPAQNVQTAINDPGRRAYGGAWSGADAYAFARGAGSHHRW